jgi:hypothetical protein
MRRRRRIAGWLTVDTKDDLAFAEAVHARLHVKAGEASLDDLLRLLEREPALKAVSATAGVKSGGSDAGAQPWSAATAAENSAMVMSSAWWRWRAPCAITKYRRAFRAEWQ